MPDMKTILVVFLFIITQQFALADDGKGCDRGDRLAGKLELTEEQSDAFFAIMEDQKNKRKEIFTEHREQMKQKMQSLHDETRNTLSSVLTDEQLAAYDELREQKIEKMKERRKHRNDWFNKTDGRNKAASATGDSEI